MIHLIQMQTYSNMIRASFLCVLGTFVVSGLYAEDHARARELYALICVNCHGPNLDGGKGPALTDAYWRHGSEPEAILKAINKGFPGSEMVAFEEALPESDRLALRDFLVSKQEGLREVTRHVYPREPFRGKRLESGLFPPVKPISHKRLPENVYYLDRNQDGVLRGTAKIYVREAGKYRFVIPPRGRSTIYVNGKEVFYYDDHDRMKKQTRINETFELMPGVHEMEFLHEEKTSHRFRFSGVLQHESGKKWPLNGRSLQGNIPKIIAAEPEAKVVRKWIAGLPPRTLLCLLPNLTLVAYNPIDGSVLNAWHSASINQTPSLADRSARPSEVKGVAIPDAGQSVLKAESLRFLRYEMHLDTVHLVSLADGREKTVMIAPEGAQSFKVSVQ